MTLPSTAPDASSDASDGAPTSVGPAGLPQRPRTLPVRQRNRVPLETLEATFAGLQQIDENARPAEPLAPPPELWPPPETGSHPRVADAVPPVSG